MKNNENMSYSRNCMDLNALFFFNQRETSISIWEKTSNFPLESSLNGSNDVCAMIDSWTKTSWGMVIDRFIGILRIYTPSPVA